MVALRKGPGTICVVHQNMERQGQGEPTMLRLGRTKINVGAKSFGGALEVELCDYEKTLRLDEAYVHTCTPRTISFER